MFNAFRSSQYTAYNASRSYFTKNYGELIELEKFLTDKLYGLIGKYADEIQRDYNEASYLYPFWQKYPPDERGRQPIGDQYPWIEVGEHAIGAKLSRVLANEFDEIRDSGIPVGPDQRFVLVSKEIADRLNDYTNAVWLFIDIKSVGPRDNFSHAVMSHNQVSGDGLWSEPAAGVSNTVLKAIGHRTSHLFHCTVPPVYVLSDGLIAPVVHIVIKPIYRMLSLSKSTVKGQPIEQITIACIPNGLLLAASPGYINMPAYRGLLFPGKDDKDKNPLKVRARISFEILEKIASWRVQHLMFATPNL